MWWAKASRYGDVTAAASPTAHSDGYVKQQRAHGPSVGLILVRADGASSPSQHGYSDEDIGNRSFGSSEAPAEARKGADCTPAGCRK